MVSSDKYSQFVLFVVNKKAKINALVGDFRMINNDDIYPSDTIHSFVG